MEKKLFKNLNYRLISLRDTMDTLNEKYQYKDICIDNYNLFCSCMDILECTLEAIKFYIKNGLCKKSKHITGENYLKIFGLLQSIYMQQNAICGLYKIQNVEFELPLRFNKIRILSDYIIGNPIYSRILTFLHKNYFDDYICSLKCYDKYIFNNLKININYYELIIDYLIELELCLKNLEELFSKFAFIE